MAPVQTPFFHLHAYVQEMQIFKIQKQEWIELGDATKTKVWL